jgi:MFS family permease
MPSERRAESQGMLAPLALPDYRRLLAGNALWWLATSMEMIAVGWLVLEMTNSPWQVALVGFYRSAPLLIFGFFSGWIASRFSRRATILSTQALYVVVLCAMAALLWAGRLTFWQVAVGECLMGVGWALDWPARRSILPDLVGKARTVDGMMMENFAINLARIVGPFTGGVLIRMLGVIGCFHVMIGLLMVGFFVLMGLPECPQTRPAGGVSPWRNLTEGLRYVRGNQRILGVLLVTVLMNALMFPYMSLLPVFARDVLHQGPVGLGILGAANGVGSFFGILGVNYLRRFARSGWVFAGGSMIQSALVLAFSASTFFPLSVSLLVLSGVGNAAFGVLQSSMVLIAASDDMRDRALGTLVLAIGAGPLGRLHIGALSDSRGVPFAVGASCAASVLSIALVTAMLPGFRARDEART